MSVSTPSRLYKAGALLVISSSLSGCFMFAPMIANQLTQTAASSAIGAASSDSAVQGATAQAIQNPLRGVELDMTVVDEMVAVLKLNDLMLNRMQVSAEAKWPERMTRDFDSFDEKSKACVDKRMAYDYRYLKLYGKTMNEKGFVGGLLAGGLSNPLSAGAQALMEQSSKKLGHAIITQKYALASKWSLKSCSIIKKRPRKNCRFIDYPVETALQESFINKDIEGFISEKVSSTCLVRAESKKYKHYSSFSTAMLTLIPKTHRNKIRKLDKDIARETRDLKRTSKKLLAQEVLQEKAKEQDKAFDDKTLVELEKRKGDIKKRISDTYDLRAEVLEQAQGEMQLSKEKALLAQNMLNIIDTAQSNLGATVTSTLALGAKIPFDMKDLGQAGLNPLGVAAKMAADEVALGGAKDLKQATKRSKERVANLVKRGAALVPNFAVITATVFTQKKAISQHEDYLKAMIKKGKELALL